MSRHPQSQLRNNPSIRLFVLCLRILLLSTTRWYGFTRITGEIWNSTLHDDSCQGSLWFGFPGGEQLSAAATYVSTRAVQGSEDAAGKRILPIPVSLVRDAKFDRFEKLVRLNPEPCGPSGRRACSACVCRFCRQNRRRLP